MSQLSDCCAPQIQTVDLLPMEFIPLGKLQYVIDQLFWTNIRKMTWIKNERWQTNGVATG